MISKLHIVRPGSLLAVLILALAGCAGSAVEDGGSTGSPQTGGATTGPGIGSSTGSTGAIETGSPRISCLPSTLSFGSVPAYEPATLSVTCTNVGPSGSRPLLIIDPPRASPRLFTTQFDPSDFPNPSAGLAPGQTARIFVHYDPTSQSIDNGTLDIPNNAGDDLQIPLSGVGLPERPCQFTVAPIELDFGNTQVGLSSSALSFEVQNVGDGLCAVEGLLIQNDATGSFHILSTTLPPDPTTGQILLLAPDAGGPSVLSVSLDFAPTQFADPLLADAVLTVLDPAGTKNPDSVLLSGESFFPDESNCLQMPPQLDLGDISWFGDAGVSCTSVSRILSFSDGCSATVTLLSVDLQSTSGDAVPQFVLNGPSLPQVLGAAVDYEIDFTPTSLGLHTAAINVARRSQHSSLTVESTIAVSAQAVPPPTETDTFVATSSMSYPLSGSPLYADEFTVEINGTRIAQLDGPNQPDWTYDAKSDAIVFTYRALLEVGDAIAVTYPIGCK